MSWFCKKEELDQVIVEKYLKKDEVTFNQDPPVTQPIVVKKGDEVLGKIELWKGKYQFKPTDINPMSFASFIFGYYEADDLCAIFLKLKELNGVKNDN